MTSTVISTDSVRPGKVIPIAVAPSPKRGCVANPPCVGPGIAHNCAWGAPQETDGPVTPFEGVKYVCNRVPGATLVTLADGTPALTHGPHKVRPFRPQAVQEINLRALTDSRVDLPGLAPLFEAVRSSGASNAL